MCEGALACVFTLRTADSGNSQTAPAHGATDSEKNFIQINNNK